MSLGTKWGQVVDWPRDGQPLRLTVEIGPNGLRRLTWGGLNLSDLYRDKVNKQFKPRDYQGPWGLYLHHSTVWFSRPKIERID
jgi:hypothetical protein